MKIKHIVVATDLTEWSLPALQAGLDLAELSAGRVTLVHTLEPPPTPPGLEAFALEGMPMDWVNRVNDAREKIVERQLAEIASANRRAPAVIETQLLQGLMPETLVEFLSKSGADLLIVGSHGRRGVAHLFLGSIAEQLMRTAPCPVLVVKPNNPA